MRRVVCRPPSGRGLSVRRAADRSSRARWPGRSPRSAMPAPTRQGPVRRAAPGTRRAPPTQLVGLTGRSVGARPSSPSSPSSNRRVSAALRATTSSETPQLARRLGGLHGAEPGGQPVLQPGFVEWRRPTARASLARSLRQRWQRAGDASSARPTAEAIGPRRAAPRSTPCRCRAESSRIGRCRLGRLASRCHRDAPALRAACARCGLPPPDVALALAPLMRGSVAEPEHLVVDHLDGEPR